MSKRLTLRVRFLSLLIGGLTVALIITIPFAAQQPPFTVERMVSNMTSALQLTTEQTERLTELMNKRRPRIDGLLQKMSQFPPDSPTYNELRGQIDGERRSALEELALSLRPDQQARLRNLMAPPPGPPGNPPRSAVATLKPNLPSGAFTDERLIPLPSTASAPSTRSRRAAAPAPQLTDEQKILHLLNRAGFGPRPGDIERVRQMGIGQYLEQQLHPEDLPDDFLDRPLLALNTLQMTQFDILQNFDPQPPRPQPTPTPAPTPAPAIKPLPTSTSEPDKGETARPGESQTQRPTAPQGQQPQQGSAPPQQPAPQLTQTAAQPAAQPTQPAAQPAPKPAPTPRIDPQQPLRELQQAKLLRAVFSDKQLQEVMVDFWLNHFNVFSQKDADRWLLTSYERDVIRARALGKFKDLLTAVAQSPAMMVYLDNFMSQVEPPPPPQKFDANGNPLPPPRRPGLNENYARELMELHTLGVDGGYTQKDVIEVARALTGWTIGPRGNMAFTFRPRAHDRGEKIILGKRIAAGGGIEDGLRVLDILSKHPSTAKFISRKLCQRFVADEPPQSLVDRVAQKFTETDGDIREVVRAILTSPEFYSPKYYRDKIKSPLELVASAVRATGASTDGLALIQNVARMGEPLYQCLPPTGYKENSAEWMSNAMLLERVNFAVALVTNKINGTRVDISRIAPAGGAGDHARVIDQYLAALLHSDVSPQTRENLMRVLDEQQAQPTPAKFDNRAPQKPAETAPGLVALILGSREFQVK
jgi:uncharacterized protein (DUF1800 family)